MLQGVSAAALQRVYDERLRFNPGAERLVSACKAAGLKTLLASGGFTFFTDRVRDRLGFRQTIYSRAAIALTTIALRIFARFAPGRLRFVPQYRAAHSSSPSPSARGPG